MAGGERKKALVVLGLSVGLGLAATLAGCGAQSRVAARLPPCAQKDYAYGQDLNGAQGAVILEGGAVRYVGRRACRVHDRVVVRLTDSRGHLLPVRGNPFRTWITAVVGPHRLNETHGVLEAWRNWCGKTARFAFTISSGAKSARYRWTRYPEPYCVDPSQPSFLRPFTDRG